MRETTYIASILNEGSVGDSVIVDIIFDCGELFESCDTLGHSSAGEDATETTDDVETFVLLTLPRFKPWLWLLF